jgi:hypothetical protein
MVLPEKSMEIIVAVAGALIILLGVIAIAGAANLIKVPGGDFFSFIGRMFGFVEQQVGLAGKETADYFCQKDLQENIKLCKITSSQLSDYCAKEDYEKVGICQNPPSGMAQFCTNSFSERTKFCSQMNSFNSACDSVRSSKNIPSTKDLPFCK